MPRRKTTTEENTTKTPEELQPKRKIGRPRKTKEEPKKTEAKTDEEPAKIPDPDPESYKTDKRVIDLHKAYTKEDVDRMVEDGETSYNETTYVDGINQTDMDWLRENIDPKNIKTPSEYFKYIKNMSSGITSESVKALFDATANALKTCVITGQKTLGQALVTKLELLTRERNAVAHGYDQVVNRTDLEAWVIDIATQAKEKKEPNPIHIIELKRYQRMVPDEVIDKVDKARNYFDMLYVAYTDYTGETVRKVEKEKRDKDPILFGAFLVPSDNGNMIPSEHLFFIADWVDEYCDLTMDQLINSYKDATGKDILLPAETFTETDIDKLKQQLKEM